MRRRILTSRVTWISLAAGLASLTVAGAGVITRPAARDVIYPASPVQRPVPPMKIGMNVGLFRYWSQEFAFADLVKVASLKVVTSSGWVDPEGRLEMNALGYPQNVPAGTTLVVILKSGGGGRLPSGVYKCEISPGWNVKASGAGRVVGSGQHFTLAVQETQSTATLSLTLAVQGKAANLDKLSCRREAAAAGDDFNTTFLADMQPFSVIRFMNWMRANDQPPQDWDKRTTPASFSQAGENGVAIEYMVGLANKLKADPWFNMPLDADDAYYRQFARYVHDHLDNDRRVYVEVSNEVWNRQFEQSKRASVKGHELYPSVSPVTANDYYYADRVRAVMAIWRYVFQDKPERLVRVLGSQAGSINRSHDTLSHQETWRSVDALAIAPYFGPGRMKLPEDRDQKSYLIEQGPVFVDKAIQNARASKGVADQFGLQLIAYEGGPAYASRQRSDASVLKAAEWDPRMYDIYTEYLRRWQREIGGLYVAFDSISAQFGHKLYTGQPLADAPKMRALTDYIQAEHLNNSRSKLSTEVQTSSVPRNHSTEN